ncbi:MAG: CRISPR-associated endonuclease Cas2 [Bacillota bacterium]
MNNKFMRVMVFFDLPVQTPQQRKIACRFRKDLLNDGYYMIQFSVYGRLCNTIENANLHVNRLQYFMPHEGSVRVMMITEKQYANMKILSGETKAEEQPVRKFQLFVF